MMAPGDRSERVQLPANCFAYAGMPEMLTKEQKEYYSSLFARWGASHVFFHHPCGVLGLLLLPLKDLFLDTSLPSPAAPQ